MCEQYFEFIFQSSCVLAFNKNSSSGLNIVTLIWNPDLIHLPSVMCSEGLFWVFVLSSSHTCSNLAANLILIYFPGLYYLQLEVSFRLDAVPTVYCKGHALCGLLAEMVRTEDL